MKKESWLVKAGAIAKADGFYSAKGERLKKVNLTEAEVAEWNGTEPAPVEEVVETPVTQEEETILEKVVKKVRRKKKK